jgi:hypothetical protein
MAMIIYCWHVIKLEGVHRAVVQQCLEQIRHNIKLTYSESSHAVPARPPGNASWTEGKALGNEEGKAVGSGFCTG